MRIQDILGIIENNFYLAFILVAVLTVFIGVGYFIIYKGLLKGKNHLNKRRIFIWFAFAGYMIMVAGVTFLNRVDGQYRSLNLHFLSTYKESWNTFSFSSWSFIILNIFMLVPFGILLPLLGKKFRKLSYIFGASLLLTLSIETTQLITGRGSFVLDDIFNNILGAIIGYGIIMSIITFIENKNKKSVIYLTPLILTIVSFVFIFGFYNSKEFGNLYIVHNHKVNMKNINLNLGTETNKETEEVFLNDNKYNINEVPIYKSKIYNKDSGKEFFIDFLKGKDIDEEIEVNSYNDMDIYWSRGEPAYSMWFYFNGGSYSYTDFSNLDDGIEKADTDKETILEKLKEFDITIPKLAKFNKSDNEDEVGVFEWKIDNHTEGNYITDGSLSVKYYNDDTIKDIDNNIIRYEKIRDIAIKSKSEALKEFEQGKFNLYNSENVRNIDIKNITLSYMMDSKGYYQPIYVFKVRIDGENQDIPIPAI